MSHDMMQERRLSAWTVAGAVAGIWLVASPVLAADYAKALVPMLAQVKPARKPVKPAFKVLYSNDFTNLGIISPYIPEVRARMFGFLKEICENDDIDGLELDFMRFPDFFKDETPLADREAIIARFVADVRQALDAGARPGRHRWLCARVPCKLDIALAATHHEAKTVLRQIWRHP